jgi:CheY-like chemotaxis protein
MSSTTPSTPRPRVLVVDDYPDGADSLTLMLRALGADARAVYDGESALRSVSEFRPDLVFLDLGLPGLTGLEVADTLRRSEGLQSTRLIAVSGRSQDEARQKSLDAGFHDYLVKPVALETIARMLEPHVSPSTFADGPAFLGV